MRRCRCRWGHGDHVRQPCFLSSPMRQPCFLSSPIDKLVLPPSPPFPLLHAKPTHPRVASRISEWMDSLHYALLPIHALTRRRAARCWTCRSRVFVPRRFSSSMESDVHAATKEKPASPAAARSPTGATLESPASDSSQLRISVCEHWVFEDSLKSGTFAAFKVVTSSRGSEQTRSCWVRWSVLKSLVATL